MGLSGSGTTYEVTCVVPDSGSGTIRLRLPANSVNGVNVPLVGSVPYSDAASNTPVIGPIEDQTLIVGTDWHTSVTISHNPDEAYVRGSLQEGFYTDFGNGVLDLYGNSPGQYSGRVSTIVAKKGSIEVTKDFRHSVVSGAPIIESFGPWTVTKGEHFEEEITIINQVTSLDIKGPWVGLGSRKGGAGAQVFGTAPADRNFTIDAGIITCVAGNNAGDITRTGMIIIEEKLTPSAPTNVLITGTTANSISLAWDAATLLSGLPAITNYVFRYRIGMGEYTVWATTGGLGLAYTIMGLDIGAPYIIQIAAQNSNGIGTPSVAHEQETDNIRTPGPVEEISISNFGSAFFNNPIDDGGSPITHYRLRVTNWGSAWFSSDVSQNVWEEESVLETMSSGLNDHIFRPSGSLSNQHDDYPSTMVIEVQAKNIAGNGEIVSVSRTFPSTDTDTE